MQGLGYADVHTRTSDFHYRVKGYVRTYISPAVTVVAELVGAQSGSQSWPNWKDFLRTPLYRILVHQ